MKTKSEQTSVTPTVEYLTDILDGINTGTLRVPNFQRPFVWKPDDMIALFESIYNGYPIGSLLFWKADKNYNTLSHIGPYRLKEDVSLPINYILDGHQRLSTLYGVLSNLKRESRLDSEDYRWDVYYDLKEGVFLHVKGKDTILPHYFALKNLLKTTEFLKATRNLFDIFKDKSEELIEKAEKLLQIFRGYRIAITQIDGGGLDSAVRIFSRLNTKGVQMSIDMMYSALTYKEGEQSFNLSIRINEIKEKLEEYNFGDIDRMIVFRAILAAAGKNIYTKVKFDLFDNENLAEIVDNCEKSLVKTVRFLSETLKVSSSNFLPHRIQLIILSEFFRLANKPSKKKLEIIEKWFWLSSFVGMNTSNGSKSQQVLDEIRAFAGIDNEDVLEFKLKVINFEEEAIPFPSRFDLQSSRVRAFSIFLASLNPISLETYKKYDTSNIIGIYGYRAFSHIARSIKNDTQKLISNPANRIIISPKDKKTTVTVKRLKHIFSNNHNIFLSVDKRKELLKSHGVNTEAVNALLRGDIKLFLKHRLNNLIKLEKEFIRKKGLIPNNSDNTADIFPDTD